MSKRLNQGRAMRATDLGLPESPELTAARLEGYLQAIRDAQNVIYIRQNRHKAFGLNKGPSLADRYAEGECILSSLCYLGSAAR